MPLFVPRKLVAALIVALFAMPAFATPGAADSTRGAAALPNALTGAAGAVALSQGGAGYVFGGSTGAARTGAILKSGPNGAYVADAATLPSPRDGMAAVSFQAGASEPSNVWLFGGQTDTGPSADILRFDADSDTITTAAARLPSVRTQAAATVALSRPASGLSDLVVVGGAAAVPLDDIILYSPSSDAAITLAAHLPSGRSASAAMWVGALGWAYDCNCNPPAARGALYVFGGDTATGATDEIVELERPGFTFNHTVETLAAKLPTPRYGMAVAAVGNDIYLFGGTDGVQTFSDVLRFDAATRTLVTMDAKLPQAVAFAAAVGGDARTGSGPVTRRPIEIVGGQTLTGATSVVQVYEPRPQAPQQLTAVASTAATVELRWLSPPNTTSAPVRVFSVEHARAATGPWALLGTTSATSFTHRDAEIGDHFYRVSADEGDRSAIATATVSASAPQDPTTARAAVVVADNFTKNPETSGNWRVVRASASASEAAWVNGHVDLTTPDYSRGAQLWARNETPHGAWHAEFDFRMGDSTSAQPADGIAFFFYADPAATYDTGGWLMMPREHAYGVLLDSYPGPTTTIAVVNGATAAGDPQLAFQSYARATRDVADGAWHHARVDYDHGAVVVWLDGDETLRTQIPNVDEEQPGFGWSAATAAANERHSIDNVSLVVGSNATTAAPAAAPVPSGLVAWWRGENDTRDASGGPSVDPKTSVAFGPGYVGRAFDVATHPLVAEWQPSLHFSASTPMTVEFWAYATSTADQAEFIAEEDCGNQVFEFGFDGDGIRLLSPGGSPNSGRHMPQEAWTHVALTYESGLARIYVNGHLAVTGNAGFGTDDLAALDLGVDHANFCGGAHLTGLLDEVSIYNRTLDASEIAAIFHAGRSGKVVPTSPSVTSAQVRNGGFDADASGWAWDGLGAGGWQATDGGHFRLTNGGSCSIDPQVSQTVDGFTAGLTYPIHGAFRAADGGAGSGGALTFALAVDQHLLLRNATVPDWTNFSVNYTPSTSGRHVLTLIGERACASGPVDIDSIGIDAPALVQAGGPTKAAAPSGLVAWWKGEGDGADSAGANTLLPVRGVSFGDGEVGRAFSFDVGDLDLRKASQLDFNGTAPMSIELWAAGRGSTADQVLIAKRDGCGTVQYQMGFDVVRGLYAQWGATPASSGVALMPERWTHVAATFDGANITLYLDGAVVASAVASPVPHVPEPLYLGGTECGYWFAGEIDEASVYDRALSAAEVQSIAGAGTGGKSGNAIVLPPTGSSSAPQVVGRIPTGLQGAAVGFDGSSVYAFAGVRYVSGQNEITRIDPGFHATSVGTLPDSNDEMTALWLDTSFYLTTGRHVGNSILQYDPASGAASYRPATFPFLLAESASATDGNDIYVFGGQDVDHYCSCPGSRAYLDTIYRYDPGTDTITLMNAHLPSPRAGMAIAWDGARFDLFGGNGEAGARYGDILRYDPVADALTISSASLPTPRFGMPAVWDGNTVDLFGGTDGATPTDEILRYAPGTDKLSVSSDVLPAPRAFAGATWNGTSAILVGGIGTEDHADEVTDEIVVYQPSSVTPDPAQSAKDATQNDAGAGGDASDDPAHPTPVTTGGATQPTYSGSVTPGADDTDAYQFTVEDPGNSGSTGFCVTVTPLHGEDIALDLISPDGFTQTNDTSGLGGEESLCAPSGHVGAGGYTVVVRDVTSATSALKGASSANLQLASLESYRIDPNCEPQCR